jgi:hypothetical protein
LTEHSPLSLKKARSKYQSFAKARRLGEVFTFMGAVAGNDDVWGVFVALAGSLDLSVISG